MGVKSKAIDQCQTSTLVLLVMTSFNLTDYTFFHGDKSGIWGLVPPGRLGESRGGGSGSGPTWDQRLREYLVPVRKQVLSAPFTRAVAAKLPMPAWWHMGQGGGQGPAGPPSRAEMLQPLVRPPTPGAGLFVVAHCCNFYNWMFFSVLMELRARIKSPG